MEDGDRVKLTGVWDRTGLRERTGYVVRIEGESAVVVFLDEGGEETHPLSALRRVVRWRV